MDLSPIFDCLENQCLLQLFQGVPKTKLVTVWVGVAVAIAAFIYYLLQKVDPMPKKRDRWLMTMGAFGGSLLVLWGLISAFMQVNFLVN